MGAEDVECRATDDLASVGSPRLAVWLGDAQHDLVREVCRATDISERLPLTSTFGRLISVALARCSVVLGFGWSLACES